MPKLAFVALPQEDESLFSWVSRFAALQGMTAKQFLACFNLSFPVDLDRIYEQHFFNALAEISDKCPYNIKNLGFARYDSFLFEQDRENSSLPWLSRVALPHKRRVFQMSLCPLCLAERPYVRLQWRLGFVFCCPRHKVWLVRETSLDDLSPMIHKDRSQEEKPLPASEEVVALQNRWLEVLEKGWTEMGRYGVQYSFVWFAVARVFARWLLGEGRFVEMRRAGEKALGLRHLPLDQFKAVESGNKFFALSLSNRAHILRCVDWLMSDYPQRFVSLCQDLRIPSRLLGKRCKNSYPFALSDPLLEHLHRPHYTAPEAEIEALKKALAKKTDGSVSLKQIREGGGYKLTTRRELSDSVHKGASYGEGRYWKLDGVTQEVKMAVRYKACEEGVTVAQWVESTLQHALLNTKATT